MSRKDEDRILHGLYYYKEQIDADMMLSGEQILWLVARSCSDGSAWAVDGLPQNFDLAAVPDEVRNKLVASKLELPLRYLQYRRLIRYAKAAGSTYQIAVTFAGADRAMRMHTRLGRVEVWYQDHRDGFVGILVTILVSLSTALLTVLLLTHLLGH